MKKVLTMILVLGLLAFAFSGCGGEEYVAPYSDDYVTTIQKDGEFKILALTDIQQSTYVKADYDFIDRLIADTDPDLITICGDLVNYDSDETVLPALIAYFEDKNIPWAPVLGNHDGDGHDSREEIATALSEADKCMFQMGDTDGYGNYVINIAEDGSTVYSLYMLDSHAYGRAINGNAKNAYAPLAQDQLDWYEYHVKHISEKTYGSYDKNGKVVKSLAFFHIPFEQFETAYYAHLDDPNIPCEGENREETCHPAIESGMFAKMVELGSTTGVYCGHDHINCASLAYQGINLTYVVKTGVGCYSTPDMLGGTLITIGADNSLTSEQVFLPYTA